MKNLKTDVNNGGEEKGEEKVGVGGGEGRQTQDILQDIHHRPFK